jgi:hypothetical protein
MTHHPHMRQSSIAYTGVSQRWGRTSSTVVMGTMRGDPILRLAPLTAIPAPLALAASLARLAT